MRINHACAPATAPKTWPSSATSLSICCAKSTTNGPSNAAASVPPGTPNICCKFWDRCDVNLDSLPCLKHVLGDIQTDRGNLHRDGSPQCDSSTTITLRHCDAGSGRRPPHHGLPSRLRRQHDRCTPDRMSFP